MRKEILAIILGAAALTASAHRISDIEQRGGWYHLYDESGRKYKTIGTGSGTLVGFSQSFFITRSGGWYHLYDSEGKKYKTLGTNSIGEIISVSGDTFTSRNGSWIKTYDRNGKLLRTRGASSY